MRHVMRAMMVIVVVVVAAMMHHHSAALARRAAAPDLSASLNVAARRIAAGADGRAVRLIGGLREGRAAERERRNRGEDMKNTHG